MKHVNAIPYLGHLAGRESDDEVLNRHTNIQKSGTIKVEMVYIG